jgi:hypothetical protein
MLYLFMQVKFDLFVTIKINKASQSQSGRHCDPPVAE